MATCALDECLAVEIDDLLVATIDYDRDPVAGLVLHLLGPAYTDLDIVADHEPERLERLAQEQAGESLRGQGLSVSAGGSSSATAIWATTWPSSVSGTRSPGRRTSQRLYPGGGDSPLGSV